MSLCIISFSIFCLLALTAAHPPRWVPTHKWPHSSGDGEGCGPKSLDSDFTIITHNDLYGDISIRTDAAIVLSRPMTESHAQQACAALGEKLWPFESRNGDFLKFLDYENMNGPYWIASKKGPSCKDITADGVMSSENCSDLMPSLCTQSAPRSNLTYANTSKMWQTTVTSGSQSWTGFRDKFGFRFQGVRYAAQPERFTYSAAYDQPGHSDTLSFGSQCVQAGGVGSEDCLFLNIWTPYLPAHPFDTSTKLKPVMMWIHGGGFTSGTGSDPTFDGGSMVSRGDVVVVTINYRLGTLGFLALEDGITNGNFGLADQITALEWLHENIRAFGGDPNRITIFGQSAGAASVRALLTSPKAAGRFAAAIPQSNLAGSNYATTYSLYYNISTEFSQFAMPILNVTNCSTAPSHLECLRKVDPHFLANQTNPALASYLVVDGTYLTTPDLPLTGNGPTNNVSVMMGFMRDDGAAFISYPQPDDTLSSFLKSNNFDPQSIKPLSAFPEPHTANHTLDIFNTSARISTDAGFRCLDESTAHVATKHNIFKEVYFYEFNRSYQLSNYSPNFPVCEAPPDAAHPHGDPRKEYFKCHSGELYYVFGTLAFNGLPERDGWDVPMEQFIVDIWTAFARTSDPNPDPAFLKARGFVNTTMETEKSGEKWMPVVSGEPLKLRLLEYPSVEEPFGVYAGQDECRAVGFPINYYETHS